MAQGERRGFEIVDDFPFMLKVSKHSEPFFSNLLVTRPINATGGGLRTFCVRNEPIVSLLKNAPNDAGVAEAGHSR